MQRAVNRQIRTLGLRDFGRFGHFFHFRACARCAGGVGDHRDARLDAECFGGVGGLNCDVGQLFSGWVRIDRAVTVDQHLIGHEHEKYAGDDVRTRRGFDDLQCWAHSVGGGVYRAGDQTVDFVQSHHHGALHHGVLQFFQCFFWRHTFGFAHFDQ